jgi:hypothetical protein
LLGIRSLLGPRLHDENPTNFDLPLHLGWNPVVADFSVPHPGCIVANLKPGAGPHEKWYFFTPTAP